MILLFPRAGAFGLLIAFAFMFLVLFGFAAHAQILGAPPPAPSLLSTLLTPANIAMAFGAVLSLVGGIQFFTAKRKRILALAVNDAFHIVEDTYNELDPGPVKDAFNKADAALKQVDASLVANGWRPMRPGEQTAAQLALQATHGVEVAKEKIAVAAATAGAAS